MEGQVVITKYKVDTGKIFGVSTVMTADIDSILQEGEAYIEGFYDPDHYKVVDGEPVSNPPEINIMAFIRDTRTGLLYESDWTQGEDVPLTEEKKAEWTTYRQELRDLPVTFVDAEKIEDVIFPILPE
tara:strand:+ start:266 stop:649 length:384 start_codon:yes stop_codon:yes gene_type:complete